MRQHEREKGKQPLDCWGKRRKCPGDIGLYVSEVVRRHNMQTLAAVMSLQFTQDQLTQLAAQFFSSFTIGLLRYDDDDGGGGGRVPYIKCLLEFLVISQSVKWWGCLWARDFCFEIKKTANGKFTADADSRRRRPLLSVEAAAFGAPIPNFGSGGVKNGSGGATGTAQGSMSLHIVQNTVQCN